MPGAPVQCRSARIRSLSQQLPEQVRLAYSASRGLDRDGGQTEMQHLHARLLGRLREACVAGDVLDGFEAWGAPRMQDRRKYTSHLGYIPKRPAEPWDWDDPGNWTYTCACWCLFYMALALSRPCSQLDYLCRNCNEKTIGDYLEAMLGEGNLTASSASSTRLSLPPTLARGGGGEGAHVRRAYHILLVVAAVEDMSARVYEDIHRRQYERWAGEALTICLPPGPPILERLRLWVQGHASHGSKHKKSAEGHLRRQERDAGRVAKRRRPGPE